MLHFIKKGNAPQKIVFIHGSSNALNYWNTALESKCLTDYELIALDLPGHGQSFISDFSERDYSIKGMSQILLKFLNEEIKENYILVGHCFGTIIIGEIAENLKGCNGIFLTNPTILGKGKTPSDILQPNPLITPYFMADSGDDDLKLLIDDATICCDDSKKQILIDNYKNTDPKVRTIIADNVATIDYNDEIAAIEKLKIPVAIAFGKEDTVTFPNYLDSIPFKLWRNEIMKIPDAGHYIQSDQPEKINQWLAMFAQDCFMQQ